MIIDFHTHIFPPNISENRDRYINADPCFSELYCNEKAKLVTAEELLRSMDEEGIDISVVVNIGWSTNELCAETNDYIMEAVAKYPDRLVGFCAVQPCDPDGAVREVERCIRGGIRGVGEIRPDIQAIDLGDPVAIDDLADLMIRNGLIFMAHCSEPVGHHYQGKGSVTPDILYPFITMYPELAIVAAHWGGGLPFYFLMREVKEASKNVYFDTAATPFLYSKDIYDHVIQLAGPEKILFGTDYPLMRQSRVIDEINSLELEDETKGMILGLNAAGLLRLDG